MGGGAAGEASWGRRREIARFGGRKQIDWR
jgi:hypothetical protein